MNPQHQHYAQLLEKVREKFVDYPLKVTVETYALCNAACTFCAYPSLQRKGEKMPAQLFEKILDDLADRPGRSPQAFGLFQVNEPFLDRRIFGFARQVFDRFPKSKLNFNTNASPLNEKLTDKLLATPNVHLLTISLNDHRPEEYEETMRLPFARTVANVRRLHQLQEAGAVPFTVRISRVGDETSADDDFEQWARREFPLFEVIVLSRADWMGLAPETSSEVPDVGCQQWFQLRFLPNGREAYCCQDGDGHFGKGDVSRQHALDIYNHPGRLRLRQRLPSRKEVAVCRNCAALGTPRKRSGTQPKPKRTVDKKMRSGAGLTAMGVLRMPVRNEQSSEMSPNLRLARIDELAGG